MDLVDKNEKDTQKCELEDFALRRNTSLFSHDFAHIREQASGGKESMNESGGSIALRRKIGKVKADRQIHALIFYKRK